MLLQVIRDRATGFFAWLIVGLIVVSFALVGLNSYFDDTDEGLQVALVNDEKVTTNEFQIAYGNEQRRYQQALGDNFDPDLFDDQIKKAAFKQVIDNTVIMQAALNSGMIVSDEQLSQRVKGIRQFSENGEFSREVYSQQLAQAGESTAGFENRVRRGLVADQYVNGIIQSSFATKDEVELTFRLREQTREVAYFTIPVAPFKEGLKIEDDEIQTYYEANQNKFKTGQKVKLEYLELSIDDLMSSITIDDGELQDYYDDQQSRFSTTEERRARHILIEFGDDDEKAKERADAIHQKIVAGESFEALAKEHSDDIGSSADGGDLGFFARDIMDPSFEEVAFSLNTGDVSKPVRSEFGYHIIKLEEIKASESKPFISVRDSIERELKKQKAEKAYFDKVEVLANMAYESPDSLEPAKEELSLTIKTTEFIGKRGIPGVFSNRKILDAAFSDDVLIENLNSEAIELSSTHSIVIRLKEFKDAKVKPLEEVKNQITAILINENALEKAKLDAEIIEAKISEGAEAVDAVKAIEGKAYSWNDKVWMKRAGSTGPQEIIQAVFDMPRDESISNTSKGVKMNNGDYSLLFFSGIKDGDSSAISEEERKSIREGIANATGVDVFATVLKSLKDKAEIQRFPSNL